MNADLAAVARLINDNARAIRQRWRASIDAAGGTGNGRIKDAELDSQCEEFLQSFGLALDKGSSDIRDETFNAVRGHLDEISRSRAAQGFTPREIATFVFSLKEPLYEQLKKIHAGDAGVVANQGWQMTLILDQLGLYTMEVYQRSREDVVRRQQEEIAELSTPVVKLWDGIIALPLIGTLDSARTQVVMENLLQAIVEQSADLAIIDITGVPTVDTLVAQHLLKTIAAARLMGADCFVSGIRPQIAQTMVHLGVQLDVVSKATLADALALAFQRTGRVVVRKSVRA